MAETLGSLIDKLAIVDLKLWHCQEALDGGGGTGANPALGTKNDSLLVQRARLIAEIDQYLIQAMEVKDPAFLMAPSNKLYGQTRKE